MIALLHELATVHHISIKGANVSVFCSQVPKSSNSNLGTTLNNQLSVSRIADTHLMVSLQQQLTNLAKCNFNYFSFLLLIICIKQDISAAANEE